MRQTREIIRVADLAVSGNDTNNFVTNNDVSVPHNVELPTDIVRADDLHTDKDSTDALHTDGQHLIDNTAYMERINGFRNTLSSSSVIIPIASSSSGRRIRLPSALPGDFHLCGCGCDRQYNGLGMVPCRSYGSVYVN